MKMYSRSFSLLGKIKPFWCSALGSWSQNYLDEGRTPLRDKDVPSALKTALEAYRQQRSAEFERSVREFIGQLGLHVIHLKDKELIHALGLPEEINPGEIDALVIVSTVKQILVLEIKDVAQSTTPRQIAREFRKFFEGDDSYVNKLQRKYDFLRNYFDNVTFDQTSGKCEFLA